MDMVQVSVNSLRGAALDWAVASLEKVPVEIEISKGGTVYLWTPLDTFPPGERGLYTPASRWEQGGPIIEREGIQLRPIRSEGHSMDGQALAKIEQQTGPTVHWDCYRVDGTGTYRVGESMLIAAMRCYVAARLGQVVDVPAEIAALTR